MTTSFPATTDRPYLADAMKTHRLYRRIFGDLPFLAESVGDGDVARIRTISGCFATYQRQFAHRAAVADRMLWPVLAVRAGPDDPVAPRIRDKRRQVLDHMAGAAALLQQWQQQPHVAQRPVVVDALAAIHAAMVDVLDDEVAHLLPLIESHFDADEWGRLCRTTRASSSRRSFVVQMGWVMDGLDSADRAEFLGTLTASQRAAWRFGGRRAWQRQRDRLHDL